MSSSSPLAGTQIFTLLLDRPAEAVRRYLDYLSSDEQHRAAHISRERDRGRYIVCRAQLRLLLAARLGRAPKSIELRYGAHGKPALARASGGWCFNLSRCGDLAVYAFARAREIGVDVEEIRPEADADRIALQTFSPSEQRDYFALAQSDKPLGFFNCWTRKEAFVKAIGGGLAAPLAQFDVSLRPDEPAQLVRVGDMPGERAGWSLASFNPAPGFIAAIAWERAPSTRGAIRNPSSQYREGDIRLSQHQPFDALQGRKP